MGEATGTPGRESPSPLPKRRERPAPPSRRTSTSSGGVEYQWRGFGCEQLRRRSPVRAPTAQIFAELLLSLPPEQRPPIYSARSGWHALTGREAALWLKCQPDRLQFVGQSSLLDLRGGNRLRNHGRRWFADVEFDHVRGLDQQARRIWWLKENCGWSLVSVTFSGHKSLHGLYLAPEQEKILERRLALALRLGACPHALRPHQPVRFPGGWNAKWQARQDCLYLNPTLTL